MKINKTSDINITGFKKSNRLSFDEVSLFEILKNVISTRTPTTSVYVSGGWTRDKLLGLQPKDIDLVVDNLDAMKFATMVAVSLGQHAPHAIRINPELSKNVPTSRMNIVLPSGAKMEIDVAKARQDIYDGNSRIPVTSDATIEEDSMRRDLTINSILYDISKDKILDFTGKGISDLKNHIIRTPLEPYKTFSDDPLRILRCIKFSSRYGWDIAPYVFNAMSDPELRQKLKTKVSRERKGIEIKEMLSTGYPEVAVELLFDSGIFEDILQDSVAETSRAGNLSGILMDQNNPHHDLVWSEHTKALARGVAKKYRGESKEKVFQVMMAAMLHDVGKLDSNSRQQKGDTTTYHGHEGVSKEITQEFMKFIKLESLSKPVEVLVDNHMRPHMLSSEQGSPKTLRKFIRNMEEAGVDWRDVINISQADAMAKGKIPEGVESKYIDLMTKGDEAIASRPVYNNSGVIPIVNGNEIMKAFGIKGGPEIGKMLDEVKDMMDENPNITKEEALQKLRALNPSKNWFDRAKIMEQG